MRSMVIGHADRRKALAVMVLDSSSIQRRQTYGTDQAAQFRGCRLKP